MQEARGKLQITNCKFEIPPAFSVVKGLDGYGEY
jgi:hypothetical protein